MTVTRRTATVVAALALSGIAVPGIAAAATPAVTPALAAVVSSHPTLRQGATGPDVADLQSRLVMAGYRTRVTGYFGPLTRAAVVELQRRHRLVADGIAGPRTWALLERVPAPRTAPGDRFPTLYPGMRGESVRELQRYLNLEARYGRTIPVTGQFDKATYEAVCAYQRRQHIPVDGIVGRWTWDLLVPHD